MENFNEMKFYAPGDLVRVRHDIDYVPVMWVVEKISRNIRNKDTGDLETMFLGIKYRWFNLKAPVILELFDGINS